MSRNRLENLDPEKQRILFEAATKEFAKNGFDGASLNQILKQSGMSKSSLYYYFDDKADLFVTLVERTAALLFKHVGHFDLDELTADNFWNYFEERYGQAVTFISNNGWVIRFGAIFYALRGDPKRGSATNRLFHTARSWVEAIIRKGQSLGLVRKDLPESLLVDSTMGLLESLDRWMVKHWEELTVEERSAMPAKHLDLFRDLLAPPAKK